MGLPPIRVNTISQPHILLLDDKVFLNDFDQTYKNRIENGRILHKNEESQYA